MRYHEFSNLPPTELFTKVVQELKRLPAAKYAEWRPATGNSIDVRYFGEWESSNPDDEDDDWETPTRKTIDELKSVCQKYGATFDVGEKNWIYITLK